MRPLKREGHRSQYCGTTDNPKHTELFHDLSSILIIAPYGDNRGALCVAFPPTREPPIQRGQLTCGRALPIILVGHVGPCRSDTDGFGCYPIRAADIVGPSGCTPEGPPRAPR